MSGAALFTGGTAEFRIGLRPIAPADWLEGGPAAPGRKTALLAAHPHAVWGSQPGSEAGQAEALALVVAHHGLSTSTCLGPPLWAASLLVADDLCLMERRNGSWTLTAASLCSPSFFTADQAVGRDLRALHGPVPGFAERLLARVERIFDALRSGVVLERRNWSLVPSAELFLPDPQPWREAYDKLSAAAALAALHLRMERQTLRRLPRTGGVMFTIRIHRHPITALASDPDRRVEFARAWDSAMSPDGEPFRRYKGLERFDPAVRAWLADQAQASPAA